MVVLIMERAPASLRGELSRWMIEPRAGVFVGRVSAMVREKLWEKACDKAKGHGVMMLYSSQSEQGFSVKSFGDTTRSLVDWEGITLVCIPEGGAPARKRKGATGAGAAVIDPLSEGEPESAPEENPEPVREKEEEPDPFGEPPLLDLPE